MLSSVAAWSSPPLAFPFLCLSDTSLSHWNLCFSKMFHLLTYHNCPVGDWIWSQCGGRVGGERELMLRMGQREAVCWGWLVTWGANWSVVETLRAVNGVTMGSAWRYKLRCLLHAMSLVSSRGGTQPLSLLLWVDWWGVKPILKEGICLNTSIYSGAIALVWKPTVFGWVMSCCEAQFPLAWVMALLLTPHAT